MTLATEVRTVDASEKHIPFVAWTILASNRSHIPRGMWDLILGDDEARTLSYLELLSQTDQTHWGSHGLFRVAEVDGQPAAAMCGFFAEELPAALMMAGAMETNPKAGLSGEEFAAGWQRAQSTMGITTLEHAPGAWVVEHAATHPDFRRRGLVKRLMQEMLERGRERGAPVADIGVFIGNDPAQRAYEKAGFEVVGEARDTAFEAAYGCPGARMMRQNL